MTLPHQLVDHSKPKQQSLNFVESYTDYCPPVQPPRVGMHDYSEQDLVRLNTCKRKVLLVARSGRWFTNRELIEVTGAIDAPKRRRELEHVDGFRFEKRKLNGTNVLAFRLQEEPDHAEQTNLGPDSAPRRT